MGYRLRLGKIAKAERVRFKGMTVDQIKACLGDDEAWYRPETHQKLYELGKYVDYSEDMENFYDFDGEENDFKIVTKEKLKEIIESYHKNIKNNFNKLFNIISNEECKDKIIDVVSHLGRKKTEWDNEFGVFPYYLDQENTDGFIASSWLYEYAIFNLVYIYRTFDWENDYLIYSGW